MAKNKPPKQPAPFKGQPAPAAARPTANLWVMLTVRMSPALRDRFKRACAANLVSMNQLLVEQVEGLCQQLERDYLASVTTKERSK